MLAHVAGGLHCSARAVVSRLRVFVCSQGSKAFVLYSLQLFWHGRPCDIVVSFGGGCFESQGPELPYKQLLV